MKSVSSEKEMLCVTLKLTQKNCTPGESEIVENVDGEDLGKRETSGNVTENDVTSDGVDKKLKSSGF